MDKYNYVKGAIFGQAIGDALGHPIEFEKGKHVSGLADDNKFTDDTQMFCAIGEALLDAPPHLGVEQFMTALTQRFVDWRNNPLGGSHRAPGGTCMEGVRRLGAGINWRKAGKTVAGKGNGTAMRSGIVGARYWKNPVTAFRIGCLTSINTHNNLESILAAGMVAYLVARSIQGALWATAVAEGLRLCAEFETHVPGYPTNDVPFDNTRNGQSPWSAIANFSRGFILGTSNTRTKAFLATSGDDFTAVPAVSEAIFFNTRHDDFDNMVLQCVNMTDDCDTVGAITGTIAGARFGFDDINANWMSGEQGPDSWVQKIELRDYLNDLSERIWAASQAEVEEEHRGDLDDTLGEEYEEGEREATLNLVIEDEEEAQVGSEQMTDLIEEDYEVEF